MAQQVVTTLIDDLDGSEAVDTITFGYKGYTYELDLSEKNLAKFDKAMGSFVQAARRVGRLNSESKTRAARGSVTRVPSDSAAVRAWAASNGVQVPTRGRIPQSVKDQYEAAQAR